LKAENQVLSERFMTEAKATLSIIAHDQPQLDDLFTALTLLYAPERKSLTEAAGLLDGDRGRRGAGAERAA
jgi:hypothetical protein